MNRSCIYAGTIRHRRFVERRRAFTHAITLLYLDLEELPDLVGGRLVRRRPGLVRVRRRDYLRPPERALADAVREEVQRHTGEHPHGRVGMLTHPRTLGHCFNPVSFYYCWSDNGNGLDAALAEVTNTPWGERHTYALAACGRATHLAAELPKAMRVSPFMSMDHHYRIHLTAPGQTASVHIENWSQDTLQFDATLSLRRRELTRATLAATVARYPLGSVRVLALIYAHAIGLRLAGVGVHQHPARGAR